MTAANGATVPAMTVFCHALQFFKDHALQEITDQSDVKITNDDVNWVITVPAIWKAPAKQFMRQAAYIVSFCTILCFNFSSVVLPMLYYACVWQVIVYVC